MTAVDRPRPGRARATTHGELSQLALSLFSTQGFDDTTIDDIVAAAGIGRRTFFRYFPSKNDLPWGDFEHLLDAMRGRLREMSPEIPVIEALRRTIVEFNRCPPAELTNHRNRMSLLLNVPSLQAHSTLRYADWRTVIAEYVAERRGESSDDLTPTTIAWACLGLCLGAYERWLAHEESDLLELLDSAFETAESVFSVTTAPPSVETRPAEVPNA